MTTPQVTAPTLQSPRPRFLRALAFTALTVAALGLGPAVGSAMAADAVFTVENTSTFEGDAMVFTVTCTDADGPGASDDCPSFIVIAGASSSPSAPANGTATEDVDYEACSVCYSTGSFEATPDTETISVPTFEDTTDENDETFTLSISGDTAIGTIVDDDGEPPPSGNADLAVGKVESADPARVGDDLVYTVAVHNFGPSSASNVTMIDTLPGNVQFISAVPTFPAQGFCSFNGVSTVTCSIGTIFAGTTHYFDIRVRPIAAGTLQNTASASSASNFDPFGGNNSATTLTATFVEGTTPPAPLPSPGVGSIANLGGPRICSWSEGSCVVLVDCTNLEQDCTAVGRGRVFISGRAVGAASYRFRGVRRAIAAGEEEELAFRVGSSSRRKIRRALRNGRRVRARVKVTVTDTAGNRTVRRRSLRVTG